jgi:hypothetical protein
MAPAARESPCPSSSILREGGEFAISDAGTTPQVDDAGLARSGPAMVGRYQTDGAVATVDELARLTALLGPLERKPRIAA